MQQRPMPTQIFHPTFHIPRDTTGRHATPRDTLWLMLLNFPNGVGGQANIAKVEVVSSNLISRSEWRLRPRGIPTFWSTSIRSAL